MDSKPIQAEQGGNNGEKQEENDAEEGKTLTFRPPH
jgi:hypothetical protein